MTALLLAGCIGNEGKLTIRSLPASPSVAVKPVPARIAEARGHLALGNVALALEGFRKAQRDDPNSTDALLGMAACYDRMGRFELSRRYYEGALAIAPADPVLLEAFARSLDYQGRASDAVEIRQELAMRRASVAPVAEPQPPSAAAAEPAQEAAAIVAPAQAPVALALAPPAASVTVPLPPAKPVRHPILAVPPTAKAPIIAQRPSSTATIVLPAPRPVSDPVAVAMPSVESAVTKDIESGSTVLANSRKREIPPFQNGPRLERLSLAEVALVTSAPTRWRGEVVRQASTSTTVRFVPLRTASREFEVRLLNAARHQGLAARTRLAMNGKGWKRVSIGDSQKVRQTSLVLYSAATSAAAKKLAAQFGFAIAKEARPGQITVLLGRDSISPAQKRS